MTHLPDPDTQPAFYDGVPGRRFFAWVLDVVLILILTFAALPFTAFTGLFFFPFLYGTISFVYRVVTIAGGSGTLGMRFAGIELRTAEGARFDLGAALLHTIGYFVSFTVAPLQVISVILMATGSRGQGLTDNLLGTVAINRRANL